jgi:hypothetical protein
MGGTGTGECCARGTAGERAGIGLAAAKRAPAGLFTAACVGGWLIEACRGPEGNAGCGMVGGGGDGVGSGGGDS